MLQGNAAARTGFSVSAIRKWRRMGVVADRRVSSPSGLERVEVRLEDVLARAALQPERHRAEPSAAATGPPARAVVIGLDDLESLFARMVDAQQRAERAEAEVASLRAQVAKAPAEPPASVRPLPAPQSPDRGQAPELLALGRRLGQIYARLEEYRQEGAVGPAAERLRQRELAEYDRVLVALCEALGLPTGLAPGQPVSASTRAGLTRALAQAGYDIRAQVVGRTGTGAS